MLISIYSRKPLCSYFYVLYLISVLSCTDLSILTLVLKYSVRFLYTASDLSIENLFLTPPAQNPNWANKIRIITFTVYGNTENQSLSILPTMHTYCLWSQISAYSVWSLSILIKITLHSNLSIFTLISLYSFWAHHLKAFENAYW